MMMAYMDENGRKLIVIEYTKSTLKMKSFDFSNYLSVSGPRYAAQISCKAICSPSNLNLYVDFEKVLVYDKR